MESASLGLPSNEPGDILNVSHVLKFPNCIKKKEGGESWKKLEQTEEERGERERVRMAEILG